jgi:anti-anti-sigma factor
LTIRESNSSTTCRKNSRKAAVRYPWPGRENLETSGLLKSIKLYDSCEAADTVITLNLEILEHGFYMLYKIPNQFNIEIVKPLRAAVDESLKKGFLHHIFDLSNTRMVTSVGIGIMMNLHGRLLQKKGSVYLLGLTPDVRTILDRTNVFKVLTEYETLSDIELKII